jgi:hypothetical protein
VEEYPMENSKIRHFGQLQPVINVWKGRVPGAGKKDRAGLQKVKTEYQRQVNAFLASKR